MKIVNNASLVDRKCATVNSAFYGTVIPNNVIVVRGNCRLAPDAHTSKKTLALLAGFLCFVQASSVIIYIQNGYIQGKSNGSTWRPVEPIHSSFSCEVTNKQEVRRTMA